jgi:diaminopimelate decarboxylase
MLESTNFNYKNNRLYCEDVSVDEIVRQVGTPVYIYSKSYFQDRYTEFSNAFSSINNTIFYAAKSNFNLSVIKTFLDLGSGVDVNSEGELIRALKAGATPGKIILTGVGKTAREIKLGLEHDVLMIKAESEEEVYLINDIASQIHKVARVALRVNPDVDAQTHPYISTGLAENKFGKSVEDALAVYSKEKELSNVKFTGIDMHIGSQIVTLDPFIEAIEKLKEVHKIVTSFDVHIEHFDIGGGIGVKYKDETPFTINDFADAIIPRLTTCGCDILFEPGRFLTANAGALIVEVLYTKKNSYKNFLVVDGAMTDLLRPSIYGSYHHIVPVNVYSNREKRIYDVVGPVCESGDFLAKNRELQEGRQNDFYAVMSAGAYAMVMASNYNARRRAPEVLVDGSSFKVVRSRETYDYLLYDESV